VSINQINEQLNDSFETYYPSLSATARFGYRVTGRLAMRLFRMRRTLFGGRLLANERMVEYPMMFRWMKERGSVLDIGCVSSRLPIQLASMGYRVDGLDTRRYPFTHPNFEFHQSDIFEWKPQEKYDIITLVSVIEHFGLGGYGDIVLPDADRHAIETITAWLKDDGQLLVSLPFGIAGVTPKHRIYDMERLKHVFGALRWNRQAYFVRRDDHWRPATPEEASQTASPSLPVNAAAVLDFGKL
jgi:2-polyprenyl-3-methyl-5-hydroxy-6-metoxy-1,4-benzoquinol methylase